jgi:tetratricopeptide (TPR) repeat protein
MRKFFYIFILILFMGCATSTTTSYKKGIIVNVVEAPKQQPGSLQCNDKKFATAYIYISNDTIKGNISSAEKKLMASYAKSALKETSYITPVENKYMPGYDDKIYPILSINVIKNEIKTVHPREDIVAKKGYFVAQMDIKLPGSSVICKSSSPISEEYYYEEPVYKTNALPSNEYIEEYMVKKAVKRAVSFFVPVTEMIFRPVISGSKIVNKSANLIDSGNCDMANKLLKEYILIHKNDAAAYYNLGVSYECLAKDVNVNNLLSILNKALKAYTNAVILDPSNKLYNNARKDINEQIKILNAVSKKSKEIKNYVNSFN